MVHGGERTAGEGDRPDAGGIYAWFKRWIVRASDLDLDPDADPTDDPVIRKALHRMANDPVPWTGPPRGSK